MSTARSRFFLATLVALLIFALAWFFGIRSLAGSEDPTLSEPAPEVACDAGGCDVRMMAWVEGRQVRSEPLPFRAQSAEIEPIPADASFGHVLPGQKARDLTAWAIGHEENGIGLAVEIVDTGVGGPAVLVFQTAGFDHVKRAHVVLTFDGIGLVAIKQRIEGPGPDFISMAPVDGGIGLRRVAPGGVFTSETLEWRPGPSGPELSPNP